MKNIYGKAFMIVCEYIEAADNTASGPVFFEIGSDAIDIAG